MPDMPRNYSIGIEEEYFLVDAETKSLVREMPRRPGQKESRWLHLLGAAEAVPHSEPPPAAEPLSVRVERLEEQVAALMNEFRELKGKLGE